MYRFKTEEELIEEYGIKYQHKCQTGTGWMIQMERLLGREITEEFYNQLHKSSAEYPDRENPPHIIQPKDLVKPMEHERLNFYVDKRIVVFETELEF